MALKNIHDLSTGSPTSSGYEEFLTALVQPAEDDTLSTGDLQSQAIYGDARQGGEQTGYPTVGYGYNLNVFTFANIEANILAALGLTNLTEQQIEQIDPNIWTALQIIEAWKDGDSWTDDDPSSDQDGATYNVVTEQNIIDLSNAQNTQSYLIDGDPQAQVALSSLTVTNAQATTLLINLLFGYSAPNNNISGLAQGTVVDTGYDVELGNDLKDFGGVDDSQERMALTDLFYNGPGLIVSSLGTILEKDLSDDNRADAWYQLRFNTPAALL